MENRAAKQKHGRALLCIAMQYTEDEKKAQTATNVRTTEPD